MPSLSSIHTWVRNRGDNSAGVVICLGNSAKFFCTHGVNASTYYVIFLLCNRKINTDVFIYNSEWKIGPFNRLNPISLLSHIITLNPFFPKNNHECFYFFYFAVCLEFCPCVAGGSGGILSRLNCHILTQPNPKTDHCDDDKDSCTCICHSYFRKSVSLEIN